MHTISSALVFLAFAGCSLASDVMPNSHSIASSRLLPLLPSEEQDRLSHPVKMLALLLAASESTSGWQGLTPSQGQAYGKLRQQKREPVTTDMMAGDEQDGSHRRRWTIPLLRTKPDFSVVVDTGATNCLAPEGTMIKLFSQHPNLLENSKIRDLQTSFGTVEGGFRANSLYAVKIPTRGGSEMIVNVLPGAVGSLPFIIGMDFIRATRGKVDFEAGGNGLVRFDGIEVACDAEEELPTLEVRLAKDGILDFVASQS